MTTALLIILSFTLFHYGTSDLTADRYINAEKWIIRTHSIPDMVEAYSDNVTVPTVFHITQDVGDFGPREIAFEYDTGLILDAARFLGFDPVKVLTHWDKSTTKFVPGFNDIMQVDFIFDIQVGFNFTTFTYDIDQQGFRMKELIRFEPNSAKINLGYTIQDPAVIKAFAVAGGSLPNSFSCNNIIFPACNVSRPGGGTYLNDTGFTTVPQCIAFLDSLPLVQPCPFYQRSNTALCRVLHGIGAFLLPSVHCAHVPAVSPVCKATCLEPPSPCNNCHANAECVATFPNIPSNFNPVYICKCKNGYVGNGTSCQASVCQYGICPALYGSYDCANPGNLCMCTETYTTNPANPGTNNLCSCPPENQIVWKNGKPICVPPGRCISEQWECNTQSYTRVKCAAYGTKPNTFTLFKSCLCNYGFTGGWEYQCQCGALKRILWSNAHSGDVCLSNTECTVDWHCNYPQHCNMTAGTDGIGKCL